MYRSELRYRLQNLPRKCIHLQVFIDSANGRVVPHLYKINQIKKCKFEKLFKILKNGKSSNKLSLVENLVDFVKLCSSGLEVFSLNNDTSTKQYFWLFKYYLESHEIPLC